MVQRRVAISPRDRADTPGGPPAKEEGSVGSCVGVEETRLQPARNGAAHHSVDVGKRHVLQVQQPSTRLLVEVVLQHHDGVGCSAEVGRGGEGGAPLHAGLPRQEGPHSVAHHCCAQAEVLQLLGEERTPMPTSTRNHLASLCLPPHRLHDPVRHGRTRHRQPLPQLLPEPAFLLYEEASLKDPLLLVCSEHWLTTLHSMSTSTALARPLRLPWKNQRRAQ